ncbi:putative membrane protein YcfT [Arthrobacter sp. UYP6]|uniref:acyltransferase family protein n=1 Tax=Arthrobacter sp. UYP6 TaxID=1756378 RepID=UPI003392D110
MSVSAGSGVAKKPRYAWVDFAKGLCMVLVVLYHLSLWVETEVESGPWLWWIVSDALNPLRMPLFFFISGYLSISSLRHPLDQTRSRTVGLYFVYILWTGMFLLRRWLPFLSTDTPPELHQLGLSLILPTSFWYLYALPLFFLVTKILLRLLGTHSVYALIPVALISALAPLVQPYTSTILGEPFDAAKIPSVLANFLWFYLGVHGTALWTRLSARPGYPMLVGALSLYAAMYSVMTLFKLELFLETALSLLALFATAQLVSRISMETTVSRGLRNIGSQTLPVYIFHIILISVLSAAVKLTGLMPFLRDVPGLAAALVPPLLVMPLILICLLAGRLIKGSRLRWLLEAPTFLVKTREGRKPQSKEEIH